MTQSAKLISPRRGRHTAYNYQYILDVGATDRKAAEAFLGKAVEWTTPGKKKLAIKGKISRVHGGKGKVVAQFEKGLPGQSMGTAVSMT
jgi:large subunit ribosomal protein L35Ae